MKPTDIMSSEKSKTPTESEMEFAEKRIFSSGESARLSGSLPPYFWPKNLVEKEEDTLPVLVLRTSISSLFVRATNSSELSRLRTSAVGCDPPSCAEAG